MLDHLNVLDALAEIGARAVVRPVSDDTPRILVRGEHFEILTTSSCELLALDISAATRRLLLMVRDLSTGQKTRYLCGHDGLGWYAAELPADMAPGDLLSASEALESPSTRHRRERLERLLRRRPSAGAGPRPTGRGPVFR